MEDLISFVRDELIESFIVISHNTRRRSLSIRNCSDKLITIRLSLGLKTPSFHIVGDSDLEVTEVNQAPKIGDTIIPISGYLIASIENPAINVVSDGITKRIVDDEIRVSMFMLSVGNYKMLMVNGSHQLVFIRVDYSKSYKIYHVRSKASVILEAMEPTARIGNRPLVSLKTIRMKLKDNSISFSEEEDLYDKVDLEDLYYEPNDY